MLEAALWGLFAAGPLLLGALVGLTFRTPDALRGLLMGFGAGALISAITFDLTLDAHELAGADAVAIGLAGGALAFFLGDRVIDRRGGHRRKHSGGHEDAGSPDAIVLGSLMDGLPEAVVIGISLLEDGGLGVAVVGAVFLSNVPEGLSASVGFAARGYSRRYIYAVWALVVLATAATAALGNGLLGGAPDLAVALIEAFAAGAVLTMLADTMMPEAFERGGNLVGLATVLGFGASFVLATL